MSDMTSDEDDFDAQLEQAYKETEGVNKSKVEIPTKRKSKFKPIGKKVSTAGSAIRSTSEEKTKGKRQAPKDGNNGEESDIFSGDSDYDPFESDDELSQQAKNTYEATGEEKSKDKRSHAPLDEKCHELLFKEEPSKEMDEEDRYKSIFSAASIGGEDAKREQLEEQPSKIRVPTDDFDVYQTYSDSDSESDEERPTKRKR